MKDCIECGATFVPVHRKDQKFCSETCSDRFKKRRQRLNRRESGLCPQCGRPLAEHPIRQGPGKAKGLKITYCAECRVRFTEWQVERRKRLKETPEA